MGGAECIYCYGSPQGLLESLHGTVRLAETSSNKNRHTYHNEAMSRATNLLTYIRAVSMCACLVYVRETRHSKVLLEAEHLRSEN